MVDHTARARRAIGAGGLVLGIAVTAACSAADGGTIGINQMLRASEADVPALCEEFFGDAESVGKRLDLTLYAATSGAGSCSYESSTGAAVILGVSIEKPSGADLFARGETYYASLSVYDPQTGSSAVAADKRESLTSWLESRANAVSDDYDTWIESLPTVDEGYADTTGFSIDWSSDEPTSLQGTLVTPFADVTVSSVSAPEYLLVDGEETSAGEGQTFVVTTFSVTEQSEPPVTPEYSLTFDDAPAGDEAAAALRSMMGGSLPQMALAVPEGVSDVFLVTSTAGETQRISLTTGEADDDGRGERLAGRTSSSSYGQVTHPGVTLGDGSEGSSSFFSWRSDPYSTSASWKISPWDATDGWAEEGQVYFDLVLSPYSPEESFPLAVEDASLTVDGAEVLATAFDPKSYTYRFVVPEGSLRIQAEVRVVPDSSQFAESYDWTPGSTVDGPIVYSFVIDPNNGNGWG